VAHAPDEALGRAVGAAIRSLRADGWTTREIADRLEVADPTVIRWENGNRVPSLDLLPKLDELCEQPRGHILRLAGYVEDLDGDVRAAVLADSRLSKQEQAMLVDIYESALRRSRATTTPSKAAATAGAVPRS